MGSSVVGLPSGWILIVFEMNRAFSFVVEVVEEI